MGRSRPKGVRKLWIRPFLAEVLGLDTKQISRLFNSGTKVSPDLVRNYIVNHGFVRPKVAKLRDTKDRSILSEDTA